MKKNKNYEENKQKYKEWANHQIQFGKDISNFSKGAAFIIIILLIAGIIAYFFNK